MGKTRDKAATISEDARLKRLMSNYSHVKVCNCAGCGKLLLGDDQPAGKRLPIRIPVVAIRLDGRPYGTCCSERYQQLYLAHQRRLLEGVT